MRVFLTVDLNALVQYDGLDIVIDSLIKHKDQVMICNDIFFILYSVTDKSKYHSTRTYIHIQVIITGKKWHFNLQTKKVWRQS